MRMLLTCLLVVCTATAAEAQSAPPQPAPGNFIYTRYGSASVMWLIYQRSAEPVFGSLVFTIGAAPDPHGDYREAFVGAGLNWNKPRYGMTPTLLFSATTEGPHLQMWLSPWFDTDHWSFNSFIGGYVPFFNEGFTQVFIDPATLTRKINNRVAVGGSWMFVHTLDAPTRHGIGPAFQVSVPKGLVIADWFVGPGSSPNEFRITFQASF